MNKKIILGVVLSLAVLSSIAMAGCQPATVVVPAPQVTVQVPAAAATSPSSLMGGTVEQMIQLQMYKSILSDTTTNNNNGGWNHHNHGH